MNVNIYDLSAVFDELMKPTDEQVGLYWFKKTRNDGIVTIISFSVHEEYCDVIVKEKNIDIASLSLDLCSDIKVLDAEKGIIEIISLSKGRILLALNGDNILNYRS